MMPMLFSLLGSTRQGGGGAAQAQAAQMRWNLGAAISLVLNPGPSPIKPRRKKNLKSSNTAFFFFSPL